MLAASRVTALIAMLFLGAVPTMAAQPAATDDDLRAFVKDVVVKDNGDPSTVDYAAAAIPETDMSVVYLNGAYYCGSGGCTMLVLRKKGTSFALVNQITISWPPIVALKTKDNGAPDLGVTVSGGGQRVHLAGLPFDGKRYARNPTVKPAYTVKDKTGTVVLIEGLDNMKPLSP